jgi:hypothetical protein
MHFLLFYEVTADYAKRRAEYRNEHLRLAGDLSARGELMLGGALIEPVDGAVLLFKADAASIVEEFAKNDPYVRNGLVTNWRIRQWATGVGDLAATPVRSA